MRRVCLTKEGLSAAIDFILYNSKEIDQDLLSEIELSKNWECEMQALNYFLSQIIQRKKKKEVLKEAFISDVYELSDQFTMGFSIDEIDRDFVDYMLSHEVLHNVELNEYLFYLKDKMLSFDYGKYIRN